MIKQFFLILILVWYIVPAFHVCEYQPMILMDKEGIRIPAHGICAVCMKVEPCKPIVGSIVSSVGRELVWEWVCCCGKKISAEKLFPSELEALKGEKK